MSQDTWPNDASAELDDLAGRRDALRQAAELPGADPRALLDAAFAELDAAVEVLAKLIQADAGEGRPIARCSDRTARWLRRSRPACSPTAPG